MKPKRFTDGQQVVCIHEGPWTHLGRPDDIAEDGPNYGDIVTIERYDKEYVDGWFLILEDYKYAYNEEYFEPIGDISELVEALTQELTV